MLVQTLCFILQLSVNLKWSYSPETPMWVQIDFLSRVTLKFEGITLKAIGHFFYAVSRFVHHFMAICEFKLELQSGNG